MKKILCLAMAAVLAVVMMAPMEARASSGYVEGTNVGPPALKSSSGAYIVGDEWDSVSSHPYDPSVTDHVYYSAYKDYVQYLTVDVKSLWEQNGYLGYYMFIAPIDLKFSATIGALESQSFSVTVQDIDFVGLSSGVQLVQSVMQYHTQFAYGGSYNLSKTLGTVRLTSSDRILTGVDGFNQVTIRIIYRVSVDSGSVGYLTAPPDITFSAAMASWGKTMFYSAPLEKSWFDSLRTSISDSFSSLEDKLGNWFTTQWTFGRQWTDDIIDAIVGQSGGASIGTAQDELDNQLNSIENVEQQLSDQVLDKVDVPSISLSSDETGGLNWVVSTINSLYVAFDELHVMFACVVFFSICAVLLFGRRNL